MEQGPWNRSKNGRAGIHFTVTHIFTAENASQMFFTLSQCQREPKIYLTDKDKVYTYVRLQKLNVTPDRVDETIVMA